MQKLFRLLLVLYLLLFNFSTLYASELTQTNADTILNIPDITAESAVLIDAKTGLVLYNKNMNDQNYPASITKIMTALLAVEQYEDNLDETLTFSYDSIFSLPRDASHIAMDEGETLTMEDALYGLLLASANEVANAIAEQIGGTVEDFAELMTRRAEALGALNTHFENPSGLFDENHYTTAYDMALILREAIKHPVFTEIISTRRHDIPPTEKLQQVRELLNNNKLIQPGPYYNEWVVGGKTGFTNEAQHTLATYAVKDDRQLIAVVMYDEKTAAFTDSNALYDYGFSLPFSEHIIFDNAAYTQTIPVMQDIDGTDVSAGEVELVGQESLRYWLPDSFDMSKVTYTPIAPTALTPPVYAGDEIGSIVCYVQDMYVGKVALKAKNTILPLTLPEEDITENTAETAIEENAAEPSEKTHSSFTDDYFSTLMLPLGISLTVLLLSAILAGSRRRKRRRSRYMYTSHYPQMGKNMFRYRN